MSNIMPSWRTTLAGVLTAAIAVFAVVAAFLDNDPNTVPQWDIAIAAVIAGAGLVFARDNAVTSEKAGAQ